LTPDIVIGGWGVLNDWLGVSAQKNDVIFGLYAE
jgi:hypothetical protein